MATKNKKKTSAWWYGLPGVGPIAASLNKSKLKTKSTPHSDHKDTGHTKLVKDKDGKVRRVKVSDQTKDKTVKGSNTSKLRVKPKSTVHTRHYKTGKPLGVMGRSQRLKYEKEAAGRTFEGEVAKYEKSSGHGKSHKRETLYKKSHRKSGMKVSKGKPIKDMSDKQKNELKTSGKTRLTRQQRNAMDTKLVKGKDGKVKRVKKKKLGSRLAKMFD